MSPQIVTGALTLVTFLWNYQQADFLPLYISLEDIPFLQQDFPSLVADLLHLIIVSARVRASEGHRKCACAVCHGEHVHLPRV
jgi:hypothetical protein